MKSARTLPLPRRPVAAEVTLKNESSVSLIAFEAPKLISIPNTDVCGSPEISFYSQEVANNEDSLSMSNFYVEIDNLSKSDESSDSSR